MIDATTTATAVTVITRILHRARETAATPRVLLLGAASTRKTSIALAVHRATSDWGGDEHDQHTASMIHGFAGRCATLLPERPLRAPHWSVSNAGLRGHHHNGTLRHPGEVSLAHGGLLYLDDAPEFRRTALRVVLDACLFGSITFPSVLIPARPQLVIGGANLCPCGRRGGGRAANCYCDARTLARWEARIPWDIFDHVVLL